MQLLSLSKRHLFVCLLMGVLSVPAVAQPVTVTGADGVEVQIDDVSRLVTLAGAVTETVYALGLGDHVVGVDASSLYPAEVQEKPQVGYFRQTSAEGILSLGPTLVLAPASMGPPAVVEQLRTAGVPVLLTNLDGWQAAPPSGTRVVT